MGGPRVRFDFERLDVFRVALDAVVIVIRKLWVARGGNGSPLA
jgi:hypothetical protein